MIYFFADSHFGKNCGKNLFERFPADLKQNTVFTEDTWEILERGEWADNCDLLILNMIGTTCGQPHPGAGAEAAVRRYVEKGGNMLLLHGSSAAFWQWEWWRKISGFRWVRPNDPDNVPKSVHPVRTFTVTPAKSRHELTAKLQGFTLPDDEIYINCEQTLPMTVLMETHIEEGIFPQCVECVNPFGGKQIIFLPGHHAPSFENAEFIADNLTLLRYLLDK